MKIDALYKKYYLNKQGWADGTTQFKKMIEAYLTNELEILDIGAGRGSVHNYKGRVGKVVGIDISDGVLDNTNLDEAYQCNVIEMPFADNSFAVAFADYVLEHLDHPIKAAKEIFRVLKPGGVLIVRTPNLWHYTGLISRLTPHRLHILLRKKLQDKFEEDTFKTYYRCNTRHWIKQVFEKAGFTIERLDMVEKEPSYLMRWCWGFMVGLFYERLVNSAKLFEGLRANIFAVFKKF
jgi:ubiquinone/menaquinone biosynthesis C-methylase UbiE